MRDSACLRNRRGAAVSVYCECFGTNKISLDKLTAAVRRLFDLQARGDYKPAGFAPAHI